MDVLQDPVVLGFALLNSLLALTLYMCFACGLFSFAQVGFMAVGAYAAGISITKHGQGPVSATFIAMGVTLLLALIVAIPMLRLRDIYLALLTFGFTEVVEVVAANATGLTGGSNGMAIPRTVDNSTLAIFLGLVILVLWRWRSSLFGHAMDSIRQDEHAAQAMGIQTRRYMIGMFIASSVVAGLGGALYAQHTFFISPGDFSFQLVLNLFLFVVVGGVHRWYGAVIGAFALTYVMQWMTPLVQWRPIVLGALLTLTVLVAPEGLTALPFRRAARRAVRGFRVRPEVDVVGSAAD